MQQMILATRPSDILQIVNYYTTPLSFLQLSPFFAQQENSAKSQIRYNQAELADYREAKATINDLLDGAKLPKMDALKQKRRELVERKKALTAQYRAAQKEMRELVTAKGNIDHLINLTGGRAGKEQTR